MIWRTVRITQPALATLAVFAAMLWLLADLPDIDVQQPVAVGWTGAWMIGAVYAAWNSWDSWLEMLATIDMQRPAREIVGSRWLFERDMFNTITAMCMTAAGWLAILQVGDVAWRTLLFLAGGLAVIALQFVNRYQRELLEHLTEDDCGDN